MARKRGAGRPGARNYVVKSGPVSTHVDQATFGWLRGSGWARVSPNDDHVAVMDPKGRLRLDHQTGTFQVDVAEPAPRDPYAIRSIFYLIFAQAIYRGVPDSELFALHDWVHADCKLPERVAA